MAGEVKKVVAATVKAAVAPKLSKVKHLAANGNAAVASGSTYEKADVTAKRLVSVPAAVGGGQQSRIDAFLKKNPVNSPEALLATFEGKSDMIAAALLAEALINSGVEVA